MALYVGTSGWAYREWKPNFYPRDLPQARFLHHYARALTACEINATFYRLQADVTLARWAAATPEGFRFAAKAHRRLTHGREIAPRGARRRFLESFLGSVSVLGPRLGAILFQFPPHRARDDAGLDELLGALPPGLPCAFEFRHESWRADDVSARIAVAGDTVCVADTSGRPPARLPPGPFGYVRLRFDRYGPRLRGAWLDLLRREAAARDVFAFTKHESAPSGDERAGVGLAAWLVRQAAHTPAQRSTADDPVTTIGPKHLIDAEGASA